MRLDQFELTPAASASNDNAELRWLPFLLKLTEHLTTGTLQEVGKLALDYLVEATGASFGDIKLIAGLGENLQAAPILHNVSAKFIAIHGEPALSDLRISVGECISYGRGLLWQAVETRQPVFVEDYSNHPGAIERFRHLGIGGLVIFPICAVDGSVVGVLTLEAPSIQELQSSRNSSVIMATCRIVGSIMDRERIEQELRLAEEQLQLAQFSLEHMSDACFWVGADGQFQFVNEAACKLLGYSRQELLALKVSDIDPAMPPEMWSHYWDNHKHQSGSTFESFHRTQQGQLIPVEITSNYLNFNGKEYCFASARNISDRKRNELLRQEAEKAHRQSEAQFRRIADSNIIGIIFSSNSGQIYDANDAFLEMVGYTREDLQAGRVRWDEMTPRSTFCWTRWPRSSCK